MKQIIVLGAGMVGSAMAIDLSKNHEVLGVTSHDVEDPTVDDDEHRPVNVAQALVHGGFKGRVQGDHGQIPLGSDPRYDAPPHGGARARGELLDRTGLAGPV